MVYSKNIEATKITSEWYLWMHHTIDKIPDNKEIKYSWQKKHLENQTGTSNSFKPVKIRKNEIKKKLEQFRALDGDMTIGVSYVKNVPISVDTIEDLKNVEKMINDNE